ncbi:MAG: sigma-70 family RNA polymerase sigma factor [Polyangiales bacterium]
MAPRDDDDGFTRLYRSESAHVMNTLRRLGVRPSDLEDVAVDVFVAVHRRWAEYDPARPARPWVRAFAVRAAADYRKSARVRREVAQELDVELRDPAPAADERVADREKQRLVLEALDALAPERREVFVLHELEGCAMPEVAAALEVPLNTAYSRLRLGREEFAAAVRRIRAKGALT